MREIIQTSYQIPLGKYRPQTVIGRMHTLRRKIFFKTNNLLISIIIFKILNFILRILGRDENNQMRLQLTAPRSSNQKKRGRVRPLSRPFPVINLTNFNQISSGVYSTA